MTNRPRVNVLLSTYNGEKYLEEQLDSILHQIDVEVFLFIRDDGSSDRTKEIIDEYIYKYPDNISFNKGENLGFANSFMYLVKTCPVADYYAFADQDDIWDSQKLISGIKYLNQNTPILYASNLKVFDSVENRRYMMYDKSDKENILNNFKNYSYIYNPYGCTMIWNHSLQNELLKYEKPDIQTHDVWVNLIANYSGNVYFDFDSFINYRVHGNNACGATPKSLGQKIKKYYTYYFIKGKSLNISVSCKSILELFEDKADENIRSFANYKKNFFSKCNAVYRLNKMAIGCSTKKKLCLLIIFNRF